MTTVLSLSDRATLSELEEVIERGLETFVDVGRALARIHDEDLYGDETFEAYLIRRWDMSWSRARQLMQGAKVADTTVSSGGIAPTTERQARALAPLKDSPKAMVEVMSRTAAKGPVTEKAIAAEVTAWLDLPAKTAKSPPKSGVVLTIPRSRDATRRVGDYTSAVAQVAQAMLTWNVAGADTESLSYLLDVIGSLKQQITTIETATRSELEVIESGQ